MKKTQIILDQDSEEVLGIVKCEEDIELLYQEWQQARKDADEEYSCSLEDFSNWLKEWKNTDINIEFEVKHI